MSLTSSNVNLTISSSDLASAVSDCASSWTTATDITIGTTQPPLNAVTTSNIFGYDYSRVYYDILDNRMYNVEKTKKEPEMKDEKKDEKKEALNVPEDKYTPERIIYNDPATIVFWKDKTKTVVKRKKGEPFNEYYAFCAALAKKMFNNNSRVNKIVKSGEDCVRKNEPVKKTTNPNFRRPKSAASKKETTTKNKR